MTAGDYEILDVTGRESFITGQIMPKRTGAKRCMKYEDLLFLKEGLLERNGKYSLDRDNITRVSPPGRIFRWDVFRGSVETSGGYVNPEGEMPEGPFELSGGVDAQMKIIAELGGNVVPEYVPYSKPFALKMEYLEKAFRNLGKMTRTVKSVSARQISRQTGINRWNDGIDYDIPVGGVGDDLYVYAWTGQEVEEDDYRGAYGETNVVAGDGIRLPYAKEAWLFAEGEISYGRNDINGSDEHHHFVVKICECTVEQEAQSKNRRITMGSVNLRSIARGVAQHFGMPFVESNASHSEGGWADIYDPFLVIDHEFPATPERDDR